MFSPSLIIGNINAKKINAEPGSGWTVVSIRGIIMIINTINMSLLLFKSVWMILKNFDKNKAVPNFANSLGWKLKGPIEYHDFAPPLSTPKMKRPIRRKIEI